MAEQIQKKLIEDELRDAYLDYAMSVITARALPDVHDGLKPVHRRVLFTMHELGLQHNKQTKKSARIVGDTMGKYHPHGDLSIYDALARMAQDFSLRYPLIAGQGNWGSIDNDPPAAMRYCVTGDSLIVTKNGLEKIENISKEENISLSILSKDKKINHASKWFDSGEHKTIKITTHKGYELTGTENHPILILTSDDYGKPVFNWKLLQDIKEGDIAVIDRKEDEFWPKSNLSLLQYYPKIKNKKTHVRILPENFNEDFAFILGILVSEGTIGKEKIEFCNTDEDLVKEFESKWKNIFPDSTLHKFKIKPSSYGKKEYYRLECHCRYTNEFLRNIGLDNVKSRFKQVPQIIFKSPKSVVSNFLKAYFEGDGGIYHSKKTNELACCSVSNKLLKEIQIILLRFGIDSFRRYEKSRDIFKLYLRGKRNILRFYKNINFFSERKRKKLEFVLLNYKKEYSATDYVPFVSDFVRNIGHSEFLTKHNFDRYNTMKESYQRVSSILLRKTKTNYASMFEYFLTYHYLFEKIITIEEAGIKKVYSLKIESDCHSFISNGFISHNTEAKLSKLADKMLEDIEKNTVNFTPNFDNSMKEPIVLPSKVPNLLLNGTAGIAVGMTSNIPPHNMNEVCDGITAMIENPEINNEELMQYIKGPDFPTGGLILGRYGIQLAYSKGKGKITIRAKCQIEKNRIIVTEIPYQVNKSLLLEGMAELVHNKTIEGISDIRDESNKKGIRVVIELKNNANAELILNQLYKHTQLQTTFGIIMLALVAGQPKRMNLRDIIYYYILHRKRIITRRTQFELDKAIDRAHILEGLIIALKDIDAVIKGIKASKTVEIAKKFLIDGYKLTEKQAIAILEMRLQRLTALEQDKIKDEHASLLKLIEELKSILASQEKILNIIKKEVLELKQEFGDNRRTEIIEASDEEVEDEDLIKKEDVVITLTHAGYIKSNSLEEYHNQRRGGTGIISTKTKEEDFVENLFVADNHSYLLCFTNLGKLHAIKAYKVPRESRYAKGVPIVNLMQLEKDEKVTTVLPVKGFASNINLMFCTKKGLVKKTPLEAFAKPRKGGVLAIKLKDNDELVTVKLSNGNFEFLIASKKGQAVRFSEKDVRVMGRNSSGVRGIRLVNDIVIGMEIAKQDSAILTVTEKGFGKRTEINEYRFTRRGGKGVRNIKVTSKNGNVVGIKTVMENDEMMFMTENGITIRTSVSGISSIGRNTQGVRLIKLKENDKVSSLARISASLIENKEN